MYKDYKKESQKRNVSHCRELIFWNMNIMANNFPCFKIFINRTKIKSEPIFFQPFSLATSKQSYIGSSPKALKKKKKFSSILFLPWIHPHFIWVTKRSANSCYISSSSVQQRLINNLPSSLILNFLYLLLLVTVRDASEVLIN